MSPGAPLVMPTRVLIVGGGGREHALAWKLSAEPGVNEVLVVPGGAALRASALGVYQMGEVQARSWSVGATTSGGAMPSFAAWIVVQRGVGISSTRA